MKLKEKMYNAAVATANAAVSAVKAIATGVVELAKSAAGFAGWLAFTAVAGTVVYAATILVSAVSLFAMWVVGDKIAKKVFGKQAGAVRDDLVSAMEREPLFAIAFATTLKTFIDKVIPENLGKNYYEKANKFVKDVVKGIRAFFASTTSDDDNKPTPPPTPPQDPVLAGSLFTLDPRLAGEFADIKTSLDNLTAIVTKPKSKTGVELAGELGEELASGAVQFAANGTYAVAATVANAAYAGAANVANAAYAGAGKVYNSLPSFSAARREFSQAAAQAAPAAQAGAPRERADSAPKSPKATLA